MEVIDHRDDDTPSYKKRWWIKASLIGLGLCLLGVIVFLTGGITWGSGVEMEPEIVSSHPSSPVSSQVSPASPTNNPSNIESLGKQYWDKLYSKTSIPKVSFLAMKNQKNLRSTLSEHDGYELTSERNLLNNPSRLRHLSKKVRRTVNGQDVLEEPNYQFIVKIKDGLTLEKSKYQTFIRDNNVLTSNIMSIVTTATNVMDIIKSDEIEWIGEYESRFKSTLNFQKLQSKAVEIKRNPTRRSKKFRNENNSSTITQKNDQSTMIRVVISIIPSIQSVTTGTQKQETEKMATDINSILSKQYVNGVDFSPMTVSTENICEIAFSPLIASHVGSILTSYPNVHYIHRKLSLSISNKSSQKLVQSVHPSLPHETPFYDLGIYGADQVVAVADTGLDWDHCFFHDSKYVSAPTSLNMNRRKVVKIRTAYSDDSTDVTNGHGTHVAGSVVGSMENTNLTSGVNAYHGVAPSAKMFFTDLAPGDGSGLYFPDDITDLLNNPYVSAASPKIFSNSWGCSIGGYVECSYDCTDCTLVSDNAPYSAGDSVTNADCNTLFGVDTCCDVCNTYESYAQGFDTFMWNHQDAAVFIAQGNDGQVSRFSNLGTPSTCKNGIAVGAHDTSSEGFIDSASYEDSGSASAYISSYLQYTNIYNENNLASFSSRGPAIGGRLKPDFVAPGFKIVSARSDGSVSTFQCGTGSPSVSSNAALLSKSGTSMATPIAAGGALLLREYLIKHRNIAAPSGHLIKAAMVHSSVPLNGTVAYSDSEFDRFSISEAFGSPNFYDGFGKIQLGSLLKDEKGRNIDLPISQNSFQSFNQTLRFCYRLKDNVTETSSFRATLAWYDYSSSVSVQSNIVNNLDLIVNTYIWKNGTNESLQVFYGNGGTEIDTKNNVERVTISNIENQDPESQIMLSVQVLNGGITGNTQPFTLLSSFVAGYWDTLPSEDCLYEVVSELTDNNSTISNSTITNSTITNSTITNSTTLNNSTLNNSTLTNNTVTDNSTFVNTTNINSTDTLNGNTTSTVDNSTIISNTTNTTDTTNSTEIDNTEVDNVNATHCYGYANTSRHVCSSNGLCIEENNCTCFDSYYGDNCEFAVCFGVYSLNESCSGQGLCVAANSCRCDSGFTGEECSVVTCNGKSENEGGCSYHGSCIDHFCVCEGNFVGVDCSTCKNGFEGTNCSTPVCNNLPATSVNVCSSHGSCDIGNSSIPQCFCYDGYFGLNCEMTTCNSINSSSAGVCNHRGQCINLDECACIGNFDPQSYCASCLPNFAGTYCNHSVCYDNTTCNSNGACNNEAECECFGNWTGTYCDHCKEGMVGTNCDIECRPSTTCNNRGICNNDGTCACIPHAVGNNCNVCENGWYGESCNFGIDSSSFGFNSNGNVIFGTIYSNYSQQINCSNLITDLSSLGTNAVCVLNGTESIFKITLGSSPFINIGDSLSLRTYPGSISSIRVNITKKDYTVIPPVARLTTDKSSIGIGCGIINLDASTSTATDGRKLYYSWYAISSPSEGSRSTLNSLINKSTSTVSFSPDMLLAGTYKIQVQVVSSFSGNYSTAMVSLSITEKALPQITIREGLEISFMIGSSSMVTPLIIFPACYNTSQTVTYVYSLNSSMSASNLVIKQDGEYLVFSDSFTKITKEGDYFFSLKAAGVSVSFKVTAKATPLKVTFNIGDMSQSFEDNVNFVVYLQDPSDSAGSMGSLSLTCHEADTSGSCDGFTSAAFNFASSITFNRAMQPGNYYFTATFNKGTRTTSASLKIKVLNVAKSTILRVLITPPTDVSTTVVDPTSDLTLEATSKDALSTSRVYKWSSSNLALSGTSNKYLVISKSVLSPGATYTVNLLITDGSKSGSTSLTFTTNSPPSIGNFTILPSQGVSLQDLFEIKCGSGWSDIHLPLKYKFMYKIKGSTDDWRVLSPASEKSIVSTYLPVGYWQIKAVVSDYYGASTESISEVTVTKPQDVSAAIESLKSIAQGTLSVSTVSSALSLLTSVTPQSSAQKTALSQSGTTCIQNFFTQIESEESLTSVTSSSVSSTLSVVSSIINTLSYLEDVAVSYGVEKFMKSMTRVNEQDSVIMKSSDVDSSIKSTDTFKNYISPKVTSRAQSSFASSDLKNIETIYSNLVDIKLKTLVADMAAVRVSGVNSYRYARHVSTLTLNSLSENVTQTISQPFTLISTFSSLTQLQGVDSVILSMISSKASNSSISAATKALEFTILVSNTPTTISSTSNIARLSLERLASSRSTAGTSLECRIETSTGIFSKAPNCTIVSSTTKLVTISVISTGTYVVVNVQEVTPVVSTITITPEVPGGASTADYSTTYIIVAASIVAAVILGSLISITLLFCILSRLLKRKKRRKVAKKQVELQTIETSRFQNILRPPSNFSLSYSNNNSPRPPNFNSPRY